LRNRILTIDPNNAQNIQLKLVPVVSWFQIIRHHI
jgi:hypothetical protein